MFHHRRASSTAAAAAAAAVAVAAEKRKTEAPPIKVPMVNVEEKPQSHPTPPKMRGEELLCICHLQMAIIMPMCFIDVTLRLLISNYYEYLN